MSFSQAGSGTTGPFLGIIAGVTSTPDLRTGTYSMAMRVRFGVSTTTLDMLLAGLSVGVNGRGIYFQRRNGDPSTVIIAYRFDGTATFNTANITGAFGSTTAWVHLGVTYDGTTIRTYLNGVANGTVASATTLIAAGAATTISLGGPFNGDAADVVMYRRALTAAEMNQIAIGRLPINRRSDLVGWWPTFDPSSLANAGVDYSTIGNHCTLQSSGANNPSASHAGIPIAFSGRSGRMVYVSAVVNNATAAGLTQVTGAAANNLSTLAAGLTQVTGSAPFTASAPSAGLVQTTGAAFPKASAPASGLTQTTGAAANNLSTHADGLTQTTGTGLGSVSGATSTGLTQTTGAAAPTLSAPASGLTQTRGDAFPTGSAPAAGLTQTTGAAVGSANGNFNGVANGLTQTTGAASGNVAAPSSGLTQTTGSANATLIFLATAAGLTRTTGDAAVSSISATASGLTVSTGDAAASSSAGGGGPALGNRQDTADRRWLGGIGARRNLRR